MTVYRGLLAVAFVVLACGAVYLQAVRGDRAVIALVSWSGGIVVALGLAEWDRRRSP